MYADDRGMGRVCLQRPRVDLREQVALHGHRRHAFIARIIDDDMPLRASRFYPAVSTPAGAWVKRAFDANLKKKQNAGDMQEQLKHGSDNGAAQALNLQEQLPEPLTRLAVIRR